jgi:hypothetical protein
MTIIPWKNESTRMTPKIELVSNDGILKIKMPEIVMIPNSYL